MGARQLFSNRHHYIKDYQGNVCSVVRQDGAVVESTDYYPYGTPFTTAGAVQPYKYGTKELDRMHGLDLYDSQARWYDSLLGRTSTLDPKSEKYYSLSPYTWCAGNPVRFIDPSGSIIENNNSGSFNMRLAEAIQYIGPEFRAIYDRLRDDPTKTFVIVDYNGKNTENLKQNTVKTEDDYSRVSICIDLKSAALLSNGDVMSPAIIAFHEFGHADAVRQDSENYGERVNDENAGNYTNKEEERNITMVENPIASRLGESVRTSNKIKEYINVKSVDHHITNSNKQ